MDERLPQPQPQPPPPPQFQLGNPMSAPSSPYSALHPLLLPSSNPHLLLKPKTLTLSLSSSSLASIPSTSSSPPAPASDAWELVHPTVTVSAASPIDGGLDDCAIFPPRLHEGLGLEVAEAEEAATKEEKDEETDEEEEWQWGWGRCRAAARRAWAAGAEAVLVHGESGCSEVRVRPAVWSAAAAAVAVGALLYVRRRDRRERDLLVLLSQEKDKRIAQLLHQIALLSDIRSGSEAIKIMRNS